MDQEKKWVLRLAQPMIVGTTFNGIDRDEVIDTIIVRCLPVNSMCEPAEDVLSVWKSIDWANSDPMIMEEFECCDLKGAVQQAYRDARRRAEEFCDVVDHAEAMGGYESHSERKARVRLATSAGEAVS